MRRCVPCRPRARAWRISIPSGDGKGLRHCPFGAALHLGEMLWGNIGAADRLDFTAIGSAVNLVSRLEGLCRPLGKMILISGALAAETDTPLIALGTHELRGIANPCAVFTLPEE
jgi:class 3 adenylate cyclase